MEHLLKTQLNGTTFSLQTGKIAKQASGAVVVQYGETIVLVTVVAADEPREVNFLPLSVEYQEKIYAAGRIPGNYFRREIGRPSEKETLTARLIDRPIRPLFPDKFNYEIQVIATVLSMDQENDAETLAMIGASAALEISDIPFAGPIASVRVGRIDGQLILNPTISQLSQCDLNIMVAGSKTGVVMVEGGADFVQEDEMLEAIFFGHEGMQPLIELQTELKTLAGLSKREFSTPAVDPQLRERISTVVGSKMHTAIIVPDKMERYKAVKKVKTEVAEALKEEYPDRSGEISEILSDVKKQVSRDLVLKEGLRIGGRGFKEVREITCEVGVLPRPHGSALFTRGETQVLGVLTIGSGQDEQRIETLSGEESRSFMLHYNFPPYSVGEVKRMGGPSRRDIGHGALASRAVEKALPSKEEFDYTLRVVSEVLESNGSSSMGTVCAAILALMDGGVPIKRPVSGIAMGLYQEGEQVVVLSDILGDEDHTGDMDFKVAGAREGITALQMDIKIHELSKEIMQQALEQARAGRLHILDKMLATLQESRQEISPHAPKMINIKINPDKIRDIIGPGGKIIRALQSETNTRIEVDDAGIVKVTAVNSQDAEEAIKRIKELTLEPEVGSVYEGVVVKTTDFGAFVRLTPGVDGLVHISELEHYRVAKVTDVVKEGDALKVKVLEIDRNGKIRLSRKALLDKGKNECKKNNSR